MGTRFELVLPSDDAGVMRAAGEAALDEIRECHERLSRFDDASQLRHLLRTADRRPVPLDADTFALFSDAIAVWEASCGAFDPTVPAGAMDAIELDHDARAVRFTHPVEALDFGAIAKGHAVDLAARALRRHRVTSAFLHGGTSSALGIGTPPEGEWRVALDAVTTIPLTDAALSVSAVWDGNPHPTIDPRTGVVLIEPRRAVVVGPSARLADAWATAALVLGRRPEALGPEWTVRIDWPAMLVPA
jgi:thiamine biosynthesis lipoprotein